MVSGYGIELSNDARKYRSRLPRNEQNKIDRAILSILEDPFGKSTFKIIPLKGPHKGKYRYRTDDFRIIYTISKGELHIFVLEIGPRGDIY